MASNAAADRQKTKKSARGPQPSRIKIVAGEKVENPKGFQVGQGRPILTIWEIGKIASRVGDGC